MSKIVIGIHGLGNKPSKDVLERWWKMSLKEGLNDVGATWIKYDFEMVYWADILHEKPLDPETTDKDSPLFLEDPYIPAGNFLKNKPKMKRSKFLDFLEKHLDKLYLNQDLSLNLSRITDLIIHKYFKDLETYFAAEAIDEENHKISAKELICNRLVQALQNHKSGKILLIAHSMGSIIAYDVLCHYVPDIEIDTFITIGSPLGHPIVMRKIFMEQKKKFDVNMKARTPENIQRRWLNLSDLEDKVAIDYELADDFKESSSRILPEDKVVYNNYFNHKKRNPHKSYGYLRTSEMAEAIRDFVTYDRGAFALWLSRMFVSFKEKFSGKKMSRNAGELLSPKDLTHDSPVN